jgi:hypothetical protein
MWMQMALTAAQHKRYAASIAHCPGKTSKHIEANY